MRHVAHSATFIVCLFCAPAGVTLGNDLELTNVAIERIKAFPERYEGKVLRFVGAEVYGRSERHLDKKTESEYFAHGVNLARDGYIASVVSDFKLTFTSSPKIAEQLMDIVGQDSKVMTNLECVLESVKTDSVSNDGFCRVLRIRSMTILNPSTKAPVKVLKE